MIQTFLNILENKEALSHDQREKLVAVYSKESTAFVESMVESKVVTEDQVLRALGQIYSIPVWETLSMDHASDSWAKDVPRRFLKTFCMVPLLQGPHGQHGPDEQKKNGQDEQALIKESIVAINDPSVLDAVDDLTMILKLSGKKWLKLWP